MLFSKAAHVVSLVVNPFTNLAPALAALFLGGAGGVTGNLIGMPLFTGILFGSLLPALYVVRLKRRGDIGEWDVRDKSQRLKPLIFGIGSYLAGFGLMALAGGSGIPLGLMFCYATNTLVVLVITRWWKISIHAVGISGPLAACQMAFGAAVYPWWGLVPLVAVSRVYLGRHTILQVAAGTALGIILTVVQIHFLFM